MSEIDTTKNAVKLIGEAFLPGASLLMDGKILAGGAHFILGTLARIALGPVGVAVVIANSYATSTTGMSLLQHFSRLAADLRASNASVAPIFGQRARTIGVRV